MKQYVAKVNLFIIGQPKSGTTALYDYLKRHPDLFLPDQKQLYYFALDHNQQRQKIKKFQKKYYRKYYNYNFDDYISHFNFNIKRQYYCDITPDYFYSNRAAFEIYKYNPDAKVILLLREPVDFLKSFHNQMINSGCETVMDFYKALSLQKKRKEKEFNMACPKQYYYYDELVDYMRFLLPFYKLFQKNLKIIIYEKFKQDNQEYLNKLFQFLEIKKIKYDKIIKSNISVPASGGIKSQIRNSYFFKILMYFIPISIKRGIKEKLFIKFKKKVYLPKDNLTKDCIFRKRKLIQIRQLNEFINSNDLLLGQEKIDLIKYWGYDKFK